MLLPVSSAPFTPQTLAAEGPIPEPLTAQSLPLRPQPAMSRARSSSPAIQSGVSNLRTSLTAVRLHRAVPDQISFGDLPCEVGDMIIAHVAADCPQTAVLGLARIAATSRYLRKILMEDGTYALHFKRLKSLVSTYNGILSTHQLSPLATGSTLSMMNSQQRHQVVERVKNGLITDLDSVSEGTAPRTHKFTMLKLICPQLALFIPADRIALVDEVCRLPNPSERRAAIDAMGEQSSNLEPAEHDKLLVAAFALAERGNPPAILGLITGLAALNSDQRLTLVKGALVADPEYVKALFLHTLGQKAGYLDKTLHPLILNAGHGMSLACSRALFVKGSAHGLASFTQDQQQRLIDAACQLEEEVHVAMALGGFGASLKDLSLDQRAQLIDATLKLDQHAIIGVAIQGMCAGMTSLDSTQQAGLVSAACHMDANEHKAKTLSFLGSIVGDLEHLQHQRIINAAVALPSVKLQVSALTGLCTQLKALNVEQRTSMVNRVLNLEDQNSKAVLVLKMVPSIAYLPFEAHRRLANAVKGITDERIKRLLMGELTHAIMSFEPKLRQELIDMILAQPANEMQASNIAELARALKPKAF